MGTRDDVAIGRAHTFSTRAAARILAISPDRIRYWVKRSLVRPLMRTGQMRFGFDDLLVMRLAKELLPTRHHLDPMRRCLERVRRMFGPSRSVTSLRLANYEGQIVVRDGPVMVEALSGRFDDHHAELARMLLDQIDALATQIGTLTTRIDELLTAMEPETRADEPDTPGGAGAVADGARELTTIERLDEIPGIGRGAAQIILAEIGFDMSRFPTAAHLVSWAKLCPRTIQSGAIQRCGKTSRGNPYLKGALGEAAAAAAKTNTFLGERYRRIVKRRGKLKALVAVARSILVIIWNLLNDPTARYADLGADYHATRINTERRTRNYVTQLMAMGYRVTLEPAA